VWKLIKWLVKFVIFMLVLLCGLWYGLKYYFAHVHRIADQVRRDVLAQIQAHHSRFLSYDEIPETYRNAVIAAEDRSFFKNIGIDMRGIGRAIFVDVGSNKPLQGGSTITQQLVHNTLLSGMQKSLSWKLRETVYAIGLYDTMSKQETFAFYANDIYFGHGAYGLYEAAETYFGREPSKLNDGELTMLAGLPNAPSVYDPFHNMQLARERQQIVVQSMVDSGMITGEEAKRIMSEPIVLRQP
jgi:membrane peptidoglycan carboxypeptidase